MKSTFLLTILMSALLLPGRALAQEASASPLPPPPGHGVWQLEFGPLLGTYHFDALTSFEDAPLFGARLGARRGRFFQLEGEFTEIYTNRKITAHSARQMSVALHGRFRLPKGRWEPSLFAGVAFVGLDDSDDIDSFGDAWDLGLGLGYRVSSHWVLRGEWMLRTQRFTLVDPNLSPEQQEDGVVSTWAHSWLLGAHYSFPAALDEPPGKRAGSAAGTTIAIGTLAREATDANAPGGRTLHLGVHTGSWDFNDAFRYENEVLYGLTAGAWLSSSFGLEIDLQRVNTRAKKSKEDAQLSFVNLHGRYRWEPRRLLSPGFVVGVSFMAADNEISDNTITEGFDLGPSLQLRLGAQTRLGVDVLFRYTSLKLKVAPADGVSSPESQVEYVWSGGARLGVDFAF